MLPHRNQYVSHGAYVCVRDISAIESWLDDSTGKLDPCILATYIPCDFSRHPHLVIRTSGSYCLQLFAETPTHAVLLGEITLEGLIPTEAADALTAVQNWADDFIIARGDT